MKTLTLSTPMPSQTVQVCIPVTPRGRALFTVDWALNSRPIRSDHDNPRLTLRQVAPR